MHRDKIIRADEHANGMRLDMIFLRIVHGRVKNHEVVAVATGFIFAIDFDRRQ